MTCTALMQVTDQLGHAQWFWRDAAGRRHFDHADAQPAWRFTDTQPGRIQISLRHSGPVVGAIEYLEHAIVGTDLLAVGVLDVEVDEVADLYASAEIRTRSNGFELAGVAITGSPAGVAAKPLVVIEGDYRKPNDRARWRTKPSAVIERAIAETPVSRRFRRPSMLVVHRPADHERRLAAGLAPLAPIAPMWGERRREYVDERAGYRPLDAGPTEIRPCGEILGVW